MTKPKYKISNEIRVRLKCFVTFSPEWHIRKIDNRQKTENSFNSSLDCEKFQFNVFVNDKIVSNSSREIHSWNLSTMQDFDWSVAKSFIFPPKNDHHVMPLNEKKEAAVRMTCHRKWISIYHREKKISTERMSWDGKIFATTSSNS